MASLSRNSRPILLDLSEEDFQRGYVGSRPPSLIAPAPRGTASKPSVPLFVAPAAAPRSGRGKTIALFVAAISASVATSQLLRRDPPATATVGVEAEKKIEKPVATIEKPVEVSEPVKPSPAPVVVAQPARPVVQPVAAPHAALQFKPIAAAAPKPVAVAPKAETTAEAKPATPTFGVDEAGF